MTECSETLFPLSAADIFCGDQLLCARLRPSNIDASAGSIEELQRIVAQIRKAWPHTQIILRADSGFCREELMAWCEQREVDYVLGFARNKRLRRKFAKEMRQAKKGQQRTGQPACVFTEFFYQTRKTWSRSRRVVAKAEQIPGKENPATWSPPFHSLLGLRGNSTNNSTAHGERWRIASKNS